MRNPITVGNLPEQLDYIPMVQYLNSEFDEGVRTFKISDIVAKVDYYQKFRDPYNAIKVRVDRVAEWGFAKVGRGEFTLIKKINIGEQL